MLGTVCRRRYARIEATEDQSQKPHQERERRFTATSPKLPCQRDPTVQSPSCASQAFWGEQS